MALEVMPLEVLEVRGQTLFLALTHPQVAVVEAPVLLAAALLGMGPMVALEVAVA